MLKLASVCSLAAGRRSNTPKIESGSDLPNGPGPVWVTLLHPPPRPRPRCTQGPEGHTPPL